MPSKRAYHVQGAVSPGREAAQQLDCRFSRCLPRAAKTGPSPVARRKPGSKHHVITDGGGIPPAASLPGGNLHDVAQLLPLVDKIPPIRGIRGRPRQRPKRIYADLG